MSNIRLFKVGADPEFGLLDNQGRLVEACDVMQVRHRFGLDGCSAIAEMRPEPSINPSQVVRNLYQDMVEGYYRSEKMQNLRWKAGSVVQSSRHTTRDEIFTIGGHIHLGIRAAVAPRVFGSRESYYEELASYLDTYLAQIMRLLEDPLELSDRVENGYGALGDYRSNSHGMEYRTLGSWLTSPRIAEGALCLAQTVAYQHIWMTAHKKEDFLLERLSPSYTAGSQDFEESSVNSHELRTYRKKFPTLRDQIRRFKLYKRHELPIEFIFKLVESNRTWFPGKDIDMKVAWGITSAARIENTRKPERVLPVVKFEDIWKRALA